MGYNKNKKIMLSIIGVAILVIGLIGITYAFFNYTRTGTQNIIKTGRISFNSTQGTAINLDNLFPIDTTVSGIMNDATKVGTVTINVTGDTTYSDGIEYLVSAVNVSNTVGSGANVKSLPISIDVSVTNNTNNDPATSLGTSDDDYFAHKGPSASTSIYKVLASDVIEENEQLLVGYIKSGATGVDGNIVIKAYIDKEKVGISDTYGNTSDRYELNTLSNDGLSDCVDYLESINYDSYLETGESLTNFCNGTGTVAGSTFQQALDNGAFNSTVLSYLVTNGIISYLGHDGTTDTWAGDRTIFTTNEWNSLQNSGVSFQVKVEANEGTWVEEPSKGIESCPDCKFMYTTNVNWATWNDQSEIPTQITSGLYDNYEELIATTGKNYFLGVKLNSNNEVTNAYACGVKDGTPFCIEGTSDGSKYTANQTLLQGANLYNNTCSLYLDSETGYGFDNVICGPWDNSGSVSAGADSLGGVDAGVGHDDGCNVYDYGYFGCYES